MTGLTLRDDDLVIRTAIEADTEQVGRIVFDTTLQNARAQHVNEPLGFREVRVNHDAWADQPGRPQSSVAYEMTPEDRR